MLTTTEVSFDCIVKLVRRGRDRIIDGFTSTYAIRGCRGHDRMVVGFTTVCTISAYNH